MDKLSVIREACARLRRLPDPQWGQAPRAPLGARAPHLAPETGGKTVEALASEWAELLMQTDAQLRGVTPFPLHVQRFALPDVIEALAKSVSASSDRTAQAVIERVGQEMQRY